jgi:beta-glucosidase
MVTLIAGSSSAQRSSTSAERHFVDSVLAKMTLEEKAGQLNQVSGLGSPTGPGGVPAGIEQIKRGDVGSFLNVVGRDTVLKLQRLAVEQSRTHIPLLFALDVIHGFRTTFPVPLGEASSWDPAAAERSARIAAQEASAEGVMWTFAPMVDIARDPRWGRIVEGAGEDTYLGSMIAAARVRGFQGRSLRDPTSILATAKHFAAYGAAEGGRDYNVADVPERTLRDVYLPPFQAAACAGVQTFMAAFNEIENIPAHANAHLLTDILRKEWKFDGAVVSDWTGVGELLNHGIGGDSASVAALSLKAGVDIDMVSEIFRKQIPALVRAGRISQKTLDEAVRRTLLLKYRLGLFQNPYRIGNASDVQGATLAQAHRTAAREIARESIVLLKNDRNVLPLSKDVGTIAVIGSLAADSGAAIGNWGAMGRAADAVSVLTGIRRAVSPRTRVLYESGASPMNNETSGIAAAVNAAKQADVVVLVVGESPEQSAEAESRAIIELSGGQNELARAIVATGKPIVAVLMNGRPLALQWLDDNVSSIVETWFLGVEHGAATADVLFGDYNPGGRLTTSFPRVTGQVPIYYNHRNTGRPPDAQNKYTSKYNDMPWTPLYPFGYGLSYTTFRYGAPRISASTMRPGDSIRVDVDVTNTGKVAGDEVVQLYIRDDVGSITRPVQELRGFKRVSLKPGETQTAHFSIDIQDLAFHDASFNRVAEPGAFTAYVGSSSKATSSLRFRLLTTGDRPVRVAATCEAVR